MQVNCLKALCGAKRVFQARPELYLSVRNAWKSCRAPSLCDVCLYPRSKRPCFDINNVTIERGNACHSKLVRAFLYAHHWPREPTVTALWMSLDSPYLAILTEKYAYSGDRLLAFERDQRTGERKLVGVLVANKTFPWVADELEEWAHYTYSKPDRHRMYFYAHCLRSPNLFKNYKCNYIYEVEVLTTAAEVQGQGVGTLLLKTALQHALELRHPLIQLVAVSQYCAKICQKCGMERAWSMAYSDFVDDAGQRVFFPRRPHHGAAVYVKRFTCEDAYRTPCKEPYI